MFSWSLTCWILDHKACIINIYILSTGISTMSSIPEMKGKCEEEGKTAWHPVHKQASAARTLCQVCWLCTKYLLKVSLNVVSALSRCKLSQLSPDETPSICSHSVSAGCAVTLICALRLKKFQKLMYCLTKVISREKYPSQTNNEPYQTQACLQSGI